MANTNNYIFKCTMGRDFATYVTLPNSDARKRGWSFIHFTNGKYTSDDMGIFRTNDAVIAKALKDDERFGIHWNLADGSDPVEPKPV